jgi:hypothetical protein
MNWEKIIEQLIALLLPLALVFVFVYQMLKSFFDQFEKNRKQEILLKVSSETITLKLQAYERISLFLERMKPESLVMRNAHEGIKTIDLHKIMIDNIREEYEHNLSQQIYVSHELWSMVISARQSIIQLITTTAEAHSPDSLFIDFATDLLKEYALSNNDPISMALKSLQHEAKQIM